MVLDKLGELFDDNALGRLKDFADSFGDNKDRIFEAVDWVWDHRDELVELTRRLPELLGQVGENLAVAGDGAVRASALLTGEDAESVGGLTGAAADALERCLEQIDSAAELMASVGGQVDDLPMLDDVGGSLVLGATRLEGIGAELDIVAGRLRAAGSTITEAGRDLAEVGSGLRDGGAELAEFGGQELPKPKPKKSKKAPPKANKPGAKTKPKAKSKAGPKTKSSSAAKPKGGGMDLGTPR